MPFHLRLLAPSALYLTLGAAAALAEPLDGVEVRGLKRTQRQTVVELLPRDAPSEYSDAELRETERRIANLQVFDHVALSRDRGDVVIEVREKWTLIPEFALSTGKTLEDLFISLGATEYNVAGRAAALGVSVYREQRGFGFAALFQEHESRRHRWGWGAEAMYGSQSSRFADGNAWYNDNGEAWLWTTSTPLAGDHLRMRALVGYGHERMVDVEGPARPPDGHQVLSGVELLWDGYRFHDYVPRGVMVTLGAGPGVFLPALQPRAWAELQVIFSRPLARYTALTGRIAANWFNRGNPNHSILLGSIEGVRGLADSLYRNWAQAYVNLELRQTIPLFERLALQAVAFADAASFAELDAYGARGPIGHAFSGGLGARVIPTFLANLLLRVDVARLVVPERDWFVQLGLAQYF